MDGESLSEADIEEVYNTGMDTGGLDFSGANLSEDQPFFIADLLSSNKLISIVHLDLSHTVMQVDGFEAILFAATEVKSLESVVAKSLQLPKEAGMSLSKLLASRGCLKVLDVSGNNLGDVGVSNLSGAFSIDHSKTLPKQLLSVVTITVLDLSGNDVGDTGALALCRGLSQFVRRASAVGVTPFLKVLRLNDNNIGDKAAICIAQLINQQAASSNAGSGGLSPVPRGGINATLQLEELALDNNPLSPRGVCALLGCSREGVISPLKRLFLANASINTDVLQLVAENLRYSDSSPLQYLNLSFSVQGVLQEILGQGVPSTKNDNSGSRGNPLRVLCSALRVLAFALVEYAAARANNSALHIELGALHSTLFNYASHLEDSAEPVPDSEAQVQEIVCTLEALNRPDVASVLNIQVVPNVAQWVRSAEYVFDEHGAAYNAAANIPPPRPPVAVRNDAAQDMRNSDDRAVLPETSAHVAAPAPAVTNAVSRPPPAAVATPVKSSFMDNFKSNLLDSSKQHNMAGILGHSAPTEVLPTAPVPVPVGVDSVSAVAPTAASIAVGLGGTSHTSTATSSDNLSLQDTSASTSAMTSASNSFKIGSTAVPTSTRDITEQKGFLNSLAFTLSSAEQEFRSLIRGAPTTVPVPTSAVDRTPAPSSVQSTAAPGKAPQVLEGENRQLRNDQTVRNKIKSAIVCYTAICS